MPQIERHPFVLSLPKAECLSCIGRPDTNGNAALAFVMQESITSSKQIAGQTTDLPSPFSTRIEEHPHQAAGAVDDRGTLPLLSDHEVGLEDLRSPRRILSEKLRWNEKRLLSRIHYGKAVFSLSRKST